MRYYKLRIGSIWLGDEFSGDHLNRAPLNIEFEVKSFHGGMAALPGYVRLYNLSPKFFSNASWYQKQRIELRAGFKHGMFAQKLGYSHVWEDLLFVGQISNVLGDFSTHTPYMDFFFMIDHEAMEDQLRRDEIDKSQMDEYTCKIPPLSPIAGFVTAGIQAFTNWIVSPSPWLLSLVNPSMQTIVITARTLSSFLYQIDKAFGIKANFDAQHQMITLYEEKGAVIPKGFAVIDSSDLLAQPERLGPDGNTISCVTRLRADIKLMSVVNLIGALPSTAQLSSGLSGGFISDIIDTKAMFSLGSYMVTEVTHKGSFYNNSPEGWATFFTAVPYGAASLLKDTLF